jgi:hypothetical protein
VKTEIIVKTQFEAIHHWPEAPDDVDFLRNPHRHIFFVEVIFSVSHGDRELEFFQIKRFIDKYLEAPASLFPVRSSCEYIAKELLNYLLHNKYSVVSVSIFEDNENGAKVSI